MKKYHFLLALRHMWRHKLFTFINLVSLVVGMVCCMLIFLFVQNELAFDHHHGKADRIFRILEKSEKLGINNAILPGVGAPIIQNEIPGIEKIIRIAMGGSESIISYNNQNIKEEEFIFADPDIIDVFSFSAKEGNPTLAKPFSVIITESTAKRYFGNKDAVGQTLKYGNAIDLTVTGVVADLPATSHFTFDFLASIDGLEKLNPATLHSWNMGGTYMYVLLQEGIDATQTAQKIEEAFLKHNPEINDETLATINDLGISIYLEPLTKIHLYSSNTTWDFAKKGDIRYVIGFSVIALILLAIACFNFANLTTANASQRSKEIGIKKTLGAPRRQLISQFYLETLLFSMAGLGISIAVTDLLLPVFNQISGKNLTLQIFSNFPLIGFIFCILVVVVLMAGSYPALYLSGLQPLKNLKSLVNTKSVGSFGKHKLKLRHVLVVSQFGIAIALIISSFFITKQLRLMMDLKLGFNKDQIVFISNPWDDQRMARYQNFSQEIQKDSRIIGVSAAQNSPGSNITNSSEISLVNEPDNEKIPVGRVAVDYDFLNVLEAELIAGRNFSEERNDSIQAVIINETAARQLQVDDPIGTIIQDVSMEGSREIIGVVKDIQYASIHEAAKPALFYLNSQVSTNAIFVKIAKGDIPATIAYLETQWQKLAPEWPFSYQFMDERIEKAYHAEIQTQKIIRIFTFLTILISCMGLFGLATLTTERRTKEVGIRKVLGASVQQIVLLLSQEFTIWVGISFVIACPLAFFTIQYWLQNFADRIAITWWVFMIAGSCAMLIAWLTVGYRAVKAAIANPVESLKSE